eukprot:TRINITY_DN6174_c0_g2_i2.p1 TRINITY_DN6174_c0_g2~~TRINITY_DN6174_c0_g2_i2.p1  ORF type:complete len:648 (+),score=43.93 TRINITY_DN6174_c0_g2_i2:255-1946(+)
MEYLVFLWLGKDTTADERASALAVATRTVDSLRGSATLVRMVQGGEPEQFLSLFRKNLFFYKGGLSAAYKARAGASDPTYDPAGVALFHVRARGGGVLFKAEQRDASCKSLCSADCFVLQTPTNPLVWVGGGSTDADKGAAIHAAEVLKPGSLVKHLVEGKETHVFWTNVGGKGDYGGARAGKEAPKDASGGSTDADKGAAIHAAEVLKPGSLVKHLVEGKETHVFWTNVGGKGDYGGARAGKEAPKDARLFQWTGAAAKEVPNFTQDDLLSADVMLMDASPELFVWVGAQTADKDKREAMAVALRFLDHLAATEGRSRDTTVVQVVEGYEPPLFTSLFGHWDHAKSGALVDPFERKLAVLQGRPVPMLDAAKRRLAALTQSAADTSSSANASPLSSAPHSPSKTPSNSSTPRPARLSFPHSASEGGGGLRFDPSPSPASTQRAAALASLVGSLKGEKLSFPTEPEPMSLPEGEEEEEEDGAGEAASGGAGAGKEEVAVEGMTYALERLVVGSKTPIRGIDTTKREFYLSDSEFSRLFGCEKSKFYALPKWKQDQQKQAFGLF